MKLALCLRLGFASVRHLEREISAREMALWIAYNNVAPFDGLREDRQVAETNHLLANIHRDQKQREDPYPLEDFMLPYGTRFRVPIPSTGGESRHPDELSPAASHAWMEMFAASWNTQFEDAE